MFSLPALQFWRLLFEIAVLAYIFLKFHVIVRPSAWVSSRFRL